MIHGPEVSAKYQGTVSGPDTTMPRVCDLHILGACLVSEGGLELPRDRDHARSRRTSDAPYGLGVSSVAPSLDASGYIRDHGRQYHAKYHGGNHPRAPPCPRSGDKPSHRTAPDAAMTAPAGA